MCRSLLKWAAASIGWKRIDPRVRSASAALQFQIAKSRFLRILTRMNRRSVLILLFVGLVFNARGIAGTLVQFRIPALGDLEVELFDQDKPVTVQNFIRYVQSGRYHDS